jgi:hypothetical protein
MENLIAHLFLARELAHRAHLRTRSYAEHIALGDFYASIVDHADAIAEAWQGKTGELLTIPFLSGDPEAEILETLKKHVEWIAVARYVAAPRDDTPIQNLIDGAVEAYLSTIYKIQFLK